MSGSTLYFASGVQVLVLKNNAIAYEGVIDQTMVDIDVGSGATLTVTLDQLEDQQAIGIGVRYAH